MDHYYAVIMAGGGGTRLWPLSRKTQPKQMLRLFDERSLFQIAVDRLAGLFPPERILVVTVAEQAQELRQQSPQIPAENFLIEPMPRGTASVVGLAAVVLQRRDPQAAMAILTADHFIGDEERFRQLLQAAHELAQTGSLVTLGIEPTFPATGYGYIQRGAARGEYNGIPAYSVVKFKEKPNQQQAQGMLESGDHAWNSGMFVWRVEDILREFERQMPALHGSLQGIAQAWGSESQAEVVSAVWAQIVPETIDYGIMEGAQQVAVLPAQGLQWNDVGSWDALFDVLPAGENGNIVRGGEHLGVDTKGSLIFAQKERLIVTIGMSDCVVVDTGDVIMVCRKEDAQKVRQVVDQLKKQGPGYL